MNLITLNLTYPDLQIQSRDHTVPYPKPCCSFLALRAACNPWFADLFRVLSPPIDCELGENRRGGGYSVNTGWKDGWKDAQWSFFAQRDGSSADTSQTPPRALGSELPFPGLCSCWGERLPQNRRQRGNWPRDATGRIGRSIVFCVRSSASLRSVPELGAVGRWRRGNFAMDIRRIESLSQTRTFCCKA